ncbi:hypothetical protein PG993_011450 [Apiospora rasikravindrae]|uniref:Uncharacterized protein n=1 Tax=Apiospora rasikravindrae TaxID=990691 RepID=A0ABR1SE92_9PEZI
MNQGTYSSLLAKMLVSSAPPMTARTLTPKGGSSLRGVSLMAYRHLLGNGDIYVKGRHHVVGTSIVDY